MSGNKSDEGNQNDSHANSCHRCDQKGELLLCDGHKCTNVGCFSCYNLTGAPAGKWFCAECEKVQGEDSGEEMDESDDDEDEDAAHLFTCVKSLQQALAQGTKPNLCEREKMLKELLQSCKVYSCTVEQLNAVLPFVKGFQQLKTELFRKITVRANFEKKQQEEKLEKQKAVDKLNTAFTLPTGTLLYDPIVNSFHFLQKVSTNDPSFKLILQIAEAKGWQVLRKGSFVTPARTARKAMTRTATKRKRAQEEKTPMDVLYDIYNRLSKEAWKKAEGRNGAKYRPRRPSFQKVFLYLFSTHLLKKSWTDILPTNKGKQFDIKTHKAWSASFKEEVEKVFKNDPRFTEEVQKNVAEGILEAMKTGRKNNNAKRQKRKVGVNTDINN